MVAGNYSLLSAFIFTLIAALQLVRAVKNWPVTIGTTSIPVWVSWAACIVAAILAWLGFTASQV
ncbi:MAG: hypothetical protein WB721_29615 [Pseudolabrys sp.]